MRRIRSEWSRVAVDEINRHPFNPRARYADERNRGEIVYFAAIAYRSRLNWLYAEAMRRKRTSSKLLEQIRDTAQNLASIGLYQLQEASR